MSSFKDFYYAGVLREMPYIVSGDYFPKEAWEPTYISSRTLLRDYSPFGSKLFSGVCVQFYSENKSDNIIGVAHALKANSEVTNEEVFSLKFKRDHERTIIKYPEDINPLDVLQVSHVYITENLNLRGRGMPSFIYASLAKSGFVVVSDADQFLDGKELWKSMAYAAKLRNYRINIINSRTGQYLKDSRGIISYDTTNVDDSDIWSHSGDFNRQDVLLTLRGN